MSRNISLVYSIIYNKRFRTSQLEEKKFDRVWYNTYTIEYGVDGDPQLYWGRAPEPGVEEILRLALSMSK